MIVKRTVSLRSGSESFTTFVSDKSAICVGAVPTANAKSSTSPSLAAPVTASPASVLIRKRMNVVPTGIDAGTSSVPKEVVEKPAGTDRSSTSCSPMSSQSPSRLRSIQTFKNAPESPPSWVIFTSSINVPGMSVAAPFTSPSSSSKPTRSSPEAVIAGNASGSGSLLVMPSFGPPGTNRCRAPSLLNCVG